jgi:hypothetical protein
MQNIFSQMGALVRNLRTEYPKPALVNKGFLRADVELVDGQGEYEFNFKAAKSAVRVGEKLLKDNDLFSALFLKFFLAAYDPANPNVLVKQTYPNVIIFPAAGTFLPEHLEAFYANGELSYEKGTGKYMEGVQLAEARFVGQTQQTGAANKTSTEHGVGGIITLPNPIDIQGTDPGVFKVNIPNPTAALKLQFSTGSLKVIAILEAHGALVSGGNKISTASANRSL